MLGLTRACRPTAASTLLCRVAAATPATVNQTATRPLSAAGGGNSDGGANAADARPPPSILAGDSGRKATHVHHSVTSFLAVTTPVYFLAPESLVDGTVGGLYGTLFAGTIAAHSWIGLNYVATDYVPKISKDLMRPAQAAVAALGALTLLGLGKVAWNDQGGIRGAVMALWRPKAYADASADAAEAEGGDEKKEKE